MVGLYARVSTSEQAENGHSLDEQVERMQKYCDALNWSIYNVYIDAGFSGANTDRPALIRLIKDIKDRKVDKVLVYKLDRLSRSQKDTLILIEDIFLSNNCDFVSMSENFDTSTPFGRAMIGILAVFAQLEREQIKERMTMGKEARAKQGKFGGSNRVPIGYDYTNGELVTNVFEKMQVVQIFSDYASGKSPRWIARKLNDAGLTHKYGTWKEQTVRDIVSKKTYLGYTFYKGSWYKGDHDAFIDEETFEKVQTIKARKYDEYKKMTRRSGKANSYLGGYLYCAHCGAKYSKESRCARGYHYAYYSCNSRSKRTKSLITAEYCRNKTWRKDELDTLIFDEIKKLAVDPSFVMHVKENYTDDRPAIIKAKITDLDNKLAKLMDLFSISGIPLELLQSKITDLNDQKIKLESEMNEIDKELKEKMTHDDAVKLAGSFSEILDNGNFDEIRTVIGSLIHKIVIDGENVTIYWAFS